MANEWGTLTWSIGNFGEQNNVTVSVSGVSAASSIGSSTVEATVDTGWSRKSWGGTPYGGAGNRCCHHYHLTSHRV